MMQSLLLLASAATAASAQVAVVDAKNLFTATITVNAATTYQKMFGGGCSGAFGAACTTNSLSASDQATVVNMLFNENIGGLSILRNIITSSAGGTILPVCPATPAGPFNYTFPTASNDSCQLTLAQLALKANRDLFLYADAWSAPGCFKSNGVESDGGYICGVRRSNCTYDWREAYANYLVEYVRLYQERGINVSMLGAYNEPDFNPITYSSMLSDGYQAYDFLSVFYPIAKKAFPNLFVSCCDATGARQERDLLYELDRLGGLNLYDIATYHNYQSEIKEPFDDLTNGKPVIETEWSDGGSAFSSGWDIQGQNFEGFQWANYMHNAFMRNVGGWSHWWCSWNGGDAALVNVQGATYQVAARLWAFAGYFRFARPGATRIEADSTVQEVRVTAWVNENGTVAIPVVNSAHYTYKLSVQLFGLGVNHATSYLTDNTHNVTMENRFSFTQGKFSAEVEPRSLKTFFLETK